MVTGTTNKRTQPSFKYTYDSITLICLWIPGNKDLLLADICKSYDGRHFSCEYDCYEQMATDVFALSIDIPTKLAMRAFLITLFSRQVDEAYALVTNLTGENCYFVQNKNVLESRLYSTPMWRESYRVVSMALLQLHGRIIGEKELSAIAMLYGTKELGVSRKEVFATLVASHEQWQKIPRTSMPLN